MKLNIVLVTYDGDQRREENWSDMTENEKKSVGAELSDRFMAAAGYYPAVPA